MRAPLHAVMPRYAFALCAPGARALGSAESELVSERHYRRASHADATLISSRLNTLAADDLSRLPCPLPRRAIYYYAAMRYLSYDAGCRRLIRAPPI